jgi:hypothetical protein
MSGRKEGNTKALGAVFNAGGKLDKGVDRFKRLPGPDILQILSSEFGIAGPACFPALRYG